MAQSELDRALDVTHNTDVARNVILFLGDGMSISTVTASRILQGRQKDELGEGNYLAFEKFPNSGLIKVSNIFYNEPYRGFFCLFRQLPLTGRVGVYRIALRLVFNQIINH